MKLFFDFLPIILFFTAYHYFGIYWATAVVVIAAVLQLLFVYWRHKKLDNLLLVSNTLVIILGLTTLLLHNPLFIKWKPTVIYWLFGGAFFLSQHLFQKKRLIQRMLDKSLNLPDAAWQRLNNLWAGFFSLMGVLNLYVVYHFSTTTWVRFKLFGTLGLTLLFVIIQGVYIAKQLNLLAKSSNT